MEVMFSVLASVAYCCFIIVLAMRPVRSELSPYEFRRRTALNRYSEHQVRRYQQYETIVSLRQIVSFVLLAVSVLFAVAALGWLYGSVAVILGVLLCGVVTRLHVVKKGARRLYGVLESKLLEWADSYEKQLRFLYVPSPESKSRDHHVASREELQQFIKKSTTILSSDERTLLSSALSFYKKTVLDSMTDWQDVTCIDADELLGPLVLDDLHKTGHDRFPVTQSEDSQVLGFVYLSQVTLLGSKKSLTARQAMQTPVHFVDHTLPLEEALKVFLETRQSILLVRDEQQAVCGIVTIADAVRVLLGQTKL
jgi:CBS domain containing-hemolysin-like protein